MFKKKRKEEYPIFEADDYYADEVLTLSANKNIDKTEGQFVEKLKRSKVFVRVFFCLFLYILFIVGGALSTPFFYNEMGKREPQIVNIETRINREHYNKLRQHFIAIRSLLLRIRELDAQLEKDNENFYYSTQYSELLTGINKNMAHLRGLYIPVRFAVLQRQMNETYDSIAIFLQKKSEALATGSPQTLAEAKTWRTQSFNKFAMLHNNMVDFSNMVKIKDKELFAPFPDR